MAELGHLERMGRELKCPICLSLVGSAVSLGCNHVFCKSCIFNSMKATSSCPVCKVPFRRREVRPAPHMDNLVSIYKNMETAAGVNIHTTQKQPVINSSESRHVCDEDQNDPCVKKSKNSKKSSLRKSKKKSICKSNEENVNLCNVQDYGSRKSTYSSLTTNKRVQIKSNLVSETPLQSEMVLKSNDLTIVEESILQNNKNKPAILKESDSLNEKCGHIFSPFFSLRENEVSDSEDMAELSSEQIADDDISDNFVPCFSDLKDSDSGTPEKLTHVVQSKQCPSSVFDGEMIECTQRECSPELFSTPMHQRVPFQSINIENKIKKNSARKKGKGFSRSLQKCTNSFADNLETKVHEGSSPYLFEGAMLASNKENHQEDKTPNSFGIDMLKSNIEDHHKEMSLPGLLCSKSKNSESMEIVVRKRKRAPESSTSQKGIRVYTSKKKNGDRCVSKNVVDKIVAHHEEMSLPGTRCKKIENSESMEFAVRNRKKTVESSTNQKKIQVYTFKEKSDINKNGDSCVSKDYGDKVVLDNQQNTKNKLRRISSESVQNFEDEEQHLHDKCGMFSTQIKCAFCKSIEETEVSGVMMHYFNGKPVVHDYNGGINVVHSHLHCTEWAPNVYFEDETALNLSDELSRSRRICCSCCGVKGAALGCFEKSCRKSFHFTCAKLVENCRWDSVNFVMLCSLHSNCKLPCEVATSSMTKKRKILKRESQNLAISKPSASTCNLWKWPLFAPYKWVFCCSALNDSEKEILVAFTKVTGIQISKSWNPNITHVIASTDENGACKRTLKVLMGILEGRWILRIDWLKSCLSNMGPVDEEKFEVSVDNHGIKDGPRLGRLRVVNEKPRLFYCFSFYFMGNFTPAYKGYLLELVNAAGGTVLQRKPIPKENIFDDIDKSKETYIIYGREQFENSKSTNDEEIFIQRQMEAESVANSCGAKCASNTWLLDSIAACTLQSL